MQYAVRLPKSRYCERQYLHPLIHNQYNRRSMGEKVLILGGGIIGLSLAVELAGCGKSVRVLERGRVMQEASWAAAGMLAALDPENPIQLLELSKKSIALWPGFRKRLEELSGGSIPFRTTLTLQGPRAGMRFEKREGRILSGPESAALCPGLLAEARTEYLLLEECSLDPRDICTALPRAATACGVEIVEECEVNGLHSSKNGIEALTRQGKFTAEKAVVATGAWAADLLPSGCGRLGLEPRKGHIVTVRLPKGITLPVVLRTPEIYLVPRGDGRVVLGATVERDGFNKAVNDAVIARLIQDAAMIFPAIGGAEIVESWTGLRPGTADGLPVLGKIDENLFVATGHYRNGILLSPATAAVMKGLITGERADLPLDEFSPERGR